MSCELEQPQIHIEEREYLKLIDSLKCELPDLLLAGVENPLDGFQKKEYEKTFLNYIEMYKQTMRDLEDAYIYSGEKEELLHSLAESVVSSVQKNLDKETKKRRRTRKLMDINMILVVYFCPALLKTNPHSGEVFAKVLIAEWKKAFPRTNLHVSSYEEIEAGFKQSYCYITTAVCQTLGKSDDCEELTLLRDYRDGYLMRLSDGKAVIREYYDVSPTIVKHINRMKEAGNIYKDIYEQYLKRCIALIRRGHNEECRKVYTKMVYDLEEKYFS